MYVIMYTIIIHVYYILPDIVHHISLITGFNLLQFLFHLLASSGQGNADILQEVMSELKGRSLKCQDPDDGIVYCRNEWKLGM